MYRIATLFQKILSILPQGAIVALGALIGIFLSANRKKQRIAFRNVKLAFPEYSDARRNAIIRASFKNFGIAILESFIPKRIYPQVRLASENPFPPDGGILVGIHEGSWEVYNWVLAHQCNYAIFARQQRHAVMDAFLNDVRRRENIKVTFTLKSLLRYLHAGCMIGLGVDHGAEDNAPMIEFFTQLVPTPRTAVHLAKKFNKKIYPGFGWRTKGLAHMLHIGAPLDPGQKTENQLLRELNEIYENYLRQHPAEYLWWYKRFKRKSTVDAIVLSDGKQGHIKQSEAFIAILNLVKSGLRTRTVQVRYRSRATRILAEFCAFFSGASCISCGRCLRILLDRPSYEELSKYYADIVVSTGSSGAAINRIFSAYMGAKSVAILRPNIPLSRFDMTILPEHDRISATNTTLIKGALFYPKELNRKTKQCKDFFNLSEQQKISVFFGGPISNTETFVKNGKLFLEKLKTFARNNRYRILVSTSRRTPEIFEKYLEKNMEKDNLTEAVVYARRANHDFIFEGFVSSSSVVFVSAESISMISEILSLKKPCVGILCERIHAKHKVFLESMSAQMQLLEPPFSLDGINPVSSSIFEDNVAAIRMAIEQRL